jgi:hypothetical protein
MGSPAENIITKCAAADPEKGGHAVIAAWLKIDVSRVYRWTYPKDRGGTGGIIPAKHQQTLLEKAKAADIRLRPADFFEAVTS